MIYNKNKVTYTTTIQSENRVTDITSIHNEKVKYIHRSCVLTTHSISLVILKHLIVNYYYDIL